MAMLEINGVISFSYSTIEYADDYLVFDPNYAIWQALNNDDKARYLVSSTRYLDSLTWEEPWSTQGAREAESKIVQACVVIAFMIVQENADFISTGTTASGTKRLKAGSAEIEYFNPNAGGSLRQRFPQQVWLLIGQFLNGANSNMGIGFRSYGTDGRSFNDKTFDYFY